MRVAQCSRRRGRARAAQLAGIEALQPSPCTSDPAVRSSRGRIAGRFCGNLPAPTRTNPKLQPMAPTQRPAALLLLLAAVLAAAMLCTAQTPPSLPAGVKQVEHGVNLLQASIDGSPLCGGCVVPGLVNRVFNVSSWTAQRTFDGRLRVPDGWSVLPNRKCSFTSELRDVHDWYDYQSTMSSYVTKRKHVLFWHSSSTDCPSTRSLARARVFLSSLRRPATRT
eukprot:m.145347 g.145347  ORF g.145347 m.145347 type:complete len:223 (+) comp10076_c0_seq3:532-1200(+)